MIIGQTGRALACLALGAGVSFLAVVTVAGPAVKRPKTAADIQWPKPSQPPGTVTFKSEYPDENVWDRLIAEFRQGTGKTFDEMLSVADRFATDKTQPRPRFRSAGKGTGDSATGGLIRSVDIVRIPAITGEALDGALGKLKSQATSLAAQNCTVMVWELTELPEKKDDLDDWAGKCFSAFSQPPILMLGWHAKGGKILPAPAMVGEFLRRYARRCHSIMLTGEELNAQFYARPDGGPAMDFFRYWTGVIRTAAPETFVWFRLDEVLYRGNSRQSAWIQELLPVTDGLCYQVSHDALATEKTISNQFAEVLRVKQQIETALRAKGHTAEHPIVLGGLGLYWPDVPGKNEQLNERRTTGLKSYEAWLGSHRIAGYIRYVGFLPAAPEAERFGPRTSQPTVAVVPGIAKDGAKPVPSDTGKHQIQELK